MIDFLRTHPNPVTNDHDPVYIEREIRSVAHVVEKLEGNGLLAVRYSANGVGIDFAVFDLACGPSTGPSGAVVDPETYYEHVFHGSGTGDPLREMRHTYWGEANNSGYIFYPDGKLIADAFKKLARWFD